MMNAQTRDLLQVATFHLMLYLLLGGAVLGACGPTFHPPEGPNTEYPCGIHGLVCAGGGCCGENDVCGFDGPFSRCAAGYCCYDGPNWPGVLQKPRKQWSPK